MTTILIVPGLGGSGPLHWQSRWQVNDARCVRVEQHDWDAPRCSEWVATLERAVREATSEVALVAHSLGVLLVAHWARTGSVQKVKGALLVAPPDVESVDRVPPMLMHFAPIPREPLPFPSIVVGSRNDDYACIDCPRELAESWRARFVDVGERGHINAESNLGAWEEGWRLLQGLL
ncbi:MAG: alpha/beta hydrolase [Myxococcaceae bacterium]|nr:alpha/beta hydrolase [Myxococcaceae bacterium]